MTRSFLLAAVVVGIASVPLSGSDPKRISGTYVESRTADVFIGACFANSQQGLAGKEGTMAWRISAGEFDDVPLAGLSVVAVVIGNSTLGDRFADYGPVRSVLIYDARATSLQRTALKAFAKTAGGSNLGAILREESAPIAFEQTQCSGEISHESHLSPVAACVRVTAGSLVRLETRNLRHSDNLCAHPELFGAPLARGVRNETPVFVPQMLFQGEGLGAKWDIPDTRGGFVGDFEIR